MQNKFTPQRTDPKWEHMQRDAKDKPAVPAKPKPASTAPRETKTYTVARKQTTPTPITQPEQATIFKPASIAQALGSEASAPPPPQEQMDGVTARSKAATPAGTHTKTGASTKHSSKHHLEGRGKKGKSDKGKDSKHSSAKDKISAADHKKWGSKAEEIRDILLMNSQKRGTYRLHFNTLISHIEQWPAGDYKKVPYFYFHNSRQLFSKVVAWLAKIEPEFQKRNAEFLSGLYLVHQLSRQVTVMIMKERDDVWGGSKKKDEDPFTLNSKIRSLRKVEPTYKVLQNRELLQKYLTDWLLHCREHMREYKQEQIAREFLTTLQTHKGLPYRNQNPPRFGGDVQTDCCICWEACFASFWETPPLKIPVKIPEAKTEAVTTPVVALG